MNSLNFHPRLRQQGAALLVSLIILMLVSLLGINSIRSTTLQERMSANILDRAVVFQSAESVLRAAEIHFVNDPRLNAHNGIDCQPGQPVCDIVPAEHSPNWRNLPNPPNLNTHLPPTGTAQYHVAYLGQVTEAAADELGQNLSALNLQYGGAEATGINLSNVYRITVRTHNPNVVGEGDGRAFVMLQSIIRVPQ